MSESAERATDRTFGTAGVIAVATAAVENGWRLVALVGCDGAKGILPSGTAAFDRGRSPSGREGASYGTASFAVSENGAAFYSGSYDLTEEEAMADFAERSGLSTGTAEEEQ
jgi:hypothetical protein